VGPPSVLCPVDFSEPSRSALCYAAAIADHFGARLTVLAVDDPLLAEVAATTGRVPSLATETTHELERFCTETLPHFLAGPKTVEFRAAVGKPATEILRKARDLNTDLIVISSHGRSGIRKMFFGSTTERVLRETPVPVLITPDDHRPIPSLVEIASHIKRIIAPVDLTPASSFQIIVAGGIAEGLSVPLIIAHVMEPIFVPYNVRLAVPGADTARRSEIEERLSALASSLVPRVRTEAIVLTGDPSEEIVKLTQARQANLIVMGLHSSGMLGPRMGSVTYRVLCLAHALVLAIPPKNMSSWTRSQRENSAEVGT
jgi:nucleotide-binding universal stress UspA family protein